jgi:hypothetical protein
MTRDERDTIQKAVSLAIDVYWKRAHDSLREGRMDQYALWVKEEATIQAALNTFLRDNQYPIPEAVFLVEKPLDK